MTGFIKIIAVTLATVICAAVLKQYKKEYAPAVQIAGAIAIIALSLSYGGDLITSAREWTGLMEAQEQYFVLLLKAVVTAILTQLICEACRDSSNGLLAACAELAGRLSILILCLPLVKSIIEIIKSML